MTRLAFFAFCLWVGTALAGTRPKPFKVFRYWDGGVATEMFFLRDGGVEGVFRDGGTFAVRVQHRPPDAGEYDEW
jgi:hypothetical protein